MSEASIKWPSATVTAEFGITRSRLRLRRRRRLSLTIVVIREPQLSLFGAASCFFDLRSQITYWPDFAPFHVALTGHPLFQRLGEFLFVLGFDRKDARSLFSVIGVS